MPSFRYSARNQGGVVSGVIHAMDRASAATQLLEQQLEPLTIEPTKKEGGWPHFWDRLFHSNTPNSDDLILFSRQMYALTRSGVPLVRAFQGLQEHAHHHMMKEVMGNIITDLQSGQNLSSALAAHPRVFVPLFTRLVHVGETTGRLDESFHYLSQYLEMDRDARQRIHTALRYPLFVLLAIVIALFVVNYFVIPAFAGVFAKFGAELPLFTRMLIATSQFTKVYWFLMLVVGVGLVQLFLMIIKTPQGRLWWDEKKLALPIVGGILYRIALARLTRTFSMGIRSGLTVVQTLSSIADTIDNTYLDKKLLLMRQGVERGESLIQAAYHSNLFSPLVLQMLSVGEETGEVANMMTEVADFYDREVGYEIKSMSAAVEPILLFVVSILVLLLALGIFLPMWNLGSVAIRPR